MEEEDLDIIDLRGRLAEAEYEYDILESNYNQLATDYEDLLLQQQDLLAWILRLMGQGEMQEAADEIKYHLAKLGYFAGDIRVH